MFQRLVNIYLWRDPLLRTSTITACVVFFVAGAVSVASLAGADHLLVIRFTGGRGIDLLGTSVDVFSLVISGFAVSVMNTFLVFALYRRVKTLAYILSIFTLVFSVLILIAAGAIIAVN
mgnify:CR=1 FL=1